jgi:hypothetical protein
LLGVQRDEGFKDFERAGKNQRLDDSVARLATSEEPPDGEKYQHETDGQAKGPGVREAATTDAQRGKANEKRERGNKKDREQGEAD